MAVHWLVSIIPHTNITIVLQCMCKGKGTQVQLRNSYRCLNAVLCYICLLNAVLSWWRHQMETFSALLAICAENSPVPGEFTAQRPVTRSFDVFFDLRLNKRLSKQWWGWWFETLLHPLWRHRNVLCVPIKSTACSSAIVLRCFFHQHLLEFANLPTYHRTKLLSTYDTF